MNMVALVFSLVRRRWEHFANFLSSIGLKAVSFGLYFAAIPFFIARQGHETYGVIAFLMMLLGYSSLFDNGITYTINLRYVRALSASAVDPEYVIGCAMPVYAVMALVMFLIILAGSPWISASIWGHPGLTYVVAGMAFVIFLQIVGSIFASVLLAHNKVSLVNASRMFADLLRVSGIFLAARSAQPLTIVVVLLAVASAGKMALDVYNCSRIVGLRKLRVRWSRAEVASILKASTVMWGIAIIGLIILVYDKWYVSARFASENYSYYSIANDLSMKVYFIFYAFTGAIYTPLIRKHATKSRTGSIYRIYVAVLLTVSLAYYGPLFIFSEKLLTWYVDADLGRNASSLVRIMIGAAMLYLVFNIFETNLYTKGLAHQVLPPYVLGAFSLVLLTPILASRYQMPGVALSVLIMQAIMLASILIIFFRTPLRAGAGKGRRYFFR
jgi:O-antigen/teichoic acid export membrane protein